MNEEKSLLFNLHKFSPKLQTKILDSSTNFCQEAASGSLEPLLWLFDLKFQ